jgi:hypothetical protein
MFCCRLPSFHELEQSRRKRSWRRWLGGYDLPSADTLAYVSERIDPDGVRGSLGHLYKRLKRNKVLEARHGWMLAAVDAHEIFSSYKRCCTKCLRRQVTVAGGAPRTQFYHRMVVFQIIAADFYFLLDLEMVLPGEDEVSAALRLVNRVLENHPRCFDVLTCDALYLRPSTIELLEKHRKYLVAVLKANQPELASEAQMLLPLEKAEHFTLLPERGKPVKHVDLRQCEGFRTESISTALRVVQAQESCQRRQRIAGSWVETNEESQWLWATTLPACLASARVIFEFGHDRWKIENEGFNELVSFWHSRHCFHHDFNALQVLLLILFMAHAVFHCFYSRNLKEELRGGHTVIHFARIIAASFRLESWWPPPT